MKKERIKGSNLFFLLYRSENLGIKSLRNFKTLKQKTKGWEMKPQRKLKKWVKISLLLLPELIIIIQLFLIGIRIKSNINDPKAIIVSESWCQCE